MNNNITVTFAERKDGEKELLYRKLEERETAYYKNFVEQTITDDRVVILATMDYKELSVVIEGILNNE